MTTSIDLYRVSPRTAKAFVFDALKAGLVPFLQSSPGMGKSSIIREIAKEANLHLIDHRVATSAPEDFTGLPEFFERAMADDPAKVQRLARFAPFDLFPIESTPIPDGRNGWMLFLDEFNQGSKSIQAAAYKLILDKMTGQYPLHSKVAIAVAGNLATDKAIVDELSTAMQSRLVHIEMEINFPEWLEDVALVQKYDERIVAFLNWKPQYLMQFDPDHSDRTFACPRTWEFVNALVKDKEIPDRMTPLIAGCIGSGIAAEFVQFSKIYKDLLTIKDILADPEGADIPGTSEKKWAIVSHLHAKTTPDTFGDVVRYIHRMDMSFQVLFYRGMLASYPEIRAHPKFAAGLQKLSHYLKED